MIRFTPEKPNLVEGLRIMYVEENPHADEGVVLGLSDGSRFVIGYSGGEGYMQMFEDEEEITLETIVKGLD